MPDKSSQPPKHAPALPPDNAPLHTQSGVDTHAMTQPLTDGPPAAIPAPGDVLAERYTLQEPLGAGTYGRVFAAWDALREHRVALKILRDTSPSALLRFKHEFRVLNQSHHSNLVRVFKLGRDQGAWFIVMELIDGVPFIMDPHIKQFDTAQHLHAKQTTRSVTQTHPRDDTPTSTSALTPDDNVTPLFDVAEIKDRIGQLCQGLVALHSRNIIHCDLKPSNVMITTTGRVVILDFGVSKYTTHLAIHNQDDGTYAGTRPYMAPEISHVDRVTASFDWYSMGMMLAELLTGHSATLLAKTPTGDLSHILERAQRTHPSYASLYALCAQLLRPNPTERATHEDVLQVCYGPTAQQVKKDVDETVENFIGRERELEALRAAYAQFKEGVMTSLVVEGSPGMGKSMLCRTFLGQVMLETPPPSIMVAQCKSSELFGYRAFDEVVDGLTAVLRMMPADVRAALLPYCTPTLCALFPALQTVDPSLQISPGALPQYPEDALHSLHTLLRKVAERRRIVIWIDDVQYADRDSLRWISRIFGPGARPNVFLLLSRRANVAVDNTSVDTDTLGYAIPRIAIRPLDDAAARTAVKYWLPTRYHDDEVLIERIIDLSDRRPDAIRSRCRDVEYMRRVEEDETLEDLTLRRINSLAPREYSVLCAAVLALSPVSFRMLTRVTQLPPLEVDQAIYSLRQDLMLRPASTVEDEQYEIWDESVYNAVIASLPADDQCALHERFATLGASDALTPMHPSLLISHLVHARQFAQAEAYALRLAEASERAGSWESAAQLLELLIDIQRAQEQRPSSELILRAIECKLRTGRLQQAADLLADLAEQSPASEAYSLHSRAAETYALCGLLQKGEAQSQRARRVALRQGILKPAIPKILRVALLRAKIEWRLRTFDPSSVDITPLDETNTALLSTYRVSGVHVGMSDALRGLEFSMHELDLALDLNRRQPIARALASFCSFTTGGGVPKSRVQGWLRLAQELADASQDRVTIEWVRACSATVDYQFGHHIEPSEQLERSYAWLAKHASHQTLILAYLDIFRIVMSISRGTIPQLRDIYYRQLSDARVQNNKNAEASVTLTGFLTWLIDDAPDAGRAALERVKTRKPHSVQLNHILWSRSFGELALYEQRAYEYTACLQQLDRYRGSMIMRNLSSLRDDIRTIQGRLTLAQAVHTGKLSSKNAARLHHWGKELSESTVPLARGWGQHILAGTYYLEGDLINASKHMQRSVNTHSAHGLMLFAELTRAAGIVTGLLEQAPDPFLTLRRMGVIQPERLTRAYHPYI